ncbi:helix-turn-helix domain-containing protein [Wenyingzhuangia heitensis]|nr:helix-turn-helix domain-containing protein [Wenyingzhuangia heitensis]
MDQVSKKLNIPRQYISEILNIHMNISFQDFINQYRVDEFISRLKNNQNNHFTLLAIAMEVGFSSKSSFNSTFKKIKGLTPSEYKKTLIR